MKILFLSGSRGEWGYIKPVIDEALSREHSCKIIATNMVVLKSFGMLIDEIKAEGYEVCDEIYMALDGQTRFSMAKSIGILVMSLVDTLKRERPDWLILSGDRGEQMAGAIAGAYAYIPTAHIQAGERSGNIDGVARHAIGRLIHLHFASNQDAADRLKRSGEEEFRVKQVGAPQLDGLASMKSSKLEFEQDTRVSLPDRYLLVVLHPVTELYGSEQSCMDLMIKVLSAIEETLSIIWILPNNDAGGSEIRRRALEIANTNVYVFSNLTRENFACLLANALVIVGNSSAGLLEAPTFALPCVNIGRRQEDRVRAKNVIDVEFDAKSLALGLAKALSHEFRRSLEGMINPYGDGAAATRIVDSLEAVIRHPDLLVKRISY